MDYIELTRERIRESIQTKNRFFIEAEDIVKAAYAVIDAYHNGGKVLLCGNGGSAADCQHIAGELIGRFKMERKSLPAIALTTDTSILTALPNDYEFDYVFERQLEGLGKKGDVLIGISTSGNSKNVIRAFLKAREMEIKTISFTGNKGGKMKELSDINIDVDSNDTPRIQECHMLAYHTLCEIVEKEMSK